MLNTILPIIATNTITLQIIRELPIILARLSNVISDLNKNKHIAIAVIDKEIIPAIATIHFTRQIKFINSSI